MKGKIGIVAVAGLIVGCLTIGGIGAAAFVGGSPYGNYKDAFFKSAAISNKTIETRVIVSRDGEVVLEGDGRMEGDGARLYALQRMQANGKTFEMEQAWTDGKGVARIDDRYFSFEGRRGHEKRERMDWSSKGAKLGEMLVDILVGDLKNNFTEKTGVVSVKLEGAQVPELLNLAAGAMLEHAASDADDEVRDGIFQDVESFGKNVFAALSVKKDAKIRSIDLNAEIEDGLLKANTFSAVLTGTDDAGAAHEIELVVDTRLAKAGATVPETIDVQGKAVTPIEKGRFHR